MSIQIYCEETQRYQDEDEMYLFYWGSKRKLQDMGFITRLPKCLYLDSLKTITKLLDPQSPDEKSLDSKPLLHGSTIQPHHLLCCPAKQS